MPLILAIGAGYAYYKKKQGPNANNNNNSITKKVTKIDPAIKLKGKTALTLHFFEREMSVFELPIATISFYLGNYEDISTPLKSRIEQIILKNPWLMGRLLPMPDLKILYDPVGVDRPPGYLTICEPGSIELHDATPYKSYNSMLKTVSVLPNSELIGQNKPLWKVSIIPDAIEPRKKFALVVSMSHLLGDAHTYYAIYNMLSIDAPQEAEALNPVRLSNYEESVQQLFGASESNYVNELLSAKSSPTEEASLSGIVSTKHEQLSDPSILTDDIADTADVKPFAPTEVLCHTPNFSKPTISDVSESLSPTEMDTSFDSKSSQGSEKDDNSCECLMMPTIENVSLLESFVQHKKENQGKKNVVKMFYINDEWIAEQKSSHQSDTISTNSIISSWFFQVNEAEFGMIMMNLRHRLPNSNLSNMDSGNYVHGVVCTEHELYSTGKIQKKIASLGNADKDCMPTVLHFDNSKKASISVNWINFHRSKHCLSTLCQPKLHIPLYDTKVMQYLPDKVSVINLFTINTSPDLVSGACPPQIGAFVVCQEESWKLIEQSGIIQKVIDCEES